MQKKDKGMGVCHIWGHCFGGRSVFVEQGRQGIFMAEPSVELWGRDVPAVVREDLRRKHRGRGRGILPGKRPDVGILAEPDGLLHGGNVMRIL